MKDEIYVSTDIEADGPIPGQNSMLSFASAAYNRERVMLGTFSSNLELLEGATEAPETRAFWNQHPAAYAETRKAMVPIASAMTSYVAWLESLPGPVVFVGYPAAYDFMWIYWYLMRFVGKSPFSHSALDLKTLAMVLLDQPYLQSTKRHMPRRWFAQRRHSHVALDDALEQGEMLCHMLEELSHKIP